MVIVFIVLVLYSLFRVLVNVVNVGVVSCCWCMVVILLVFSIIYDSRLFLI